ncbi:MAG: restriction endonuclease subunit S [Deltaproteobacteria bacterium]|nr:restriction endonuclease subunit S [Deltaproteobacteria bacterium]
MVGSNRWPIRRLQDCAVWYSGGTPNKATPHYWGGTIPWISAKSITGFFISDSEDRVTEDGARNGTRLVPANTILFIVRGMSLKSEFRMGITTRPVTFNQDLKALVPVDGVNPDFLAYAIKARTEEILGLVGEAGHGTGVLPTDRIQSIEIPIPSLPEQRAIAHILGALDDKIELNRKTNETLEAMARALFESWFVNFDPVRAKAAGRAPAGMDEATAKLFPSEFEKSELGDVPKGWRYSPALGLFELVSGGTPKTEVAEYWGGSIFWASAKDVSQGSSSLFLMESERTITEHGLASSAAKLIPAGSVVVVARGATCGRHVVLGAEMAINQTCYALVAHEQTDRWYVAFIAETLLARLVQQAHGSVFDTITRRTFETALTVHPTSAVRGAFTREVAPWIELVHLKQRQSRTLAALRDTLLPKLLSGELAIRDAETFVGRAV